MKVLREWQSYEREVIPKGAPAVQREECRRAFYAGAMACFTLVLEASEPADERECERRLQALQDEIKAMPHDLRIEK